jgi:hypothetical protein
MHTIRPSSQIDLIGSIKLKLDSCIDGCPSPHLCSHGCPSEASKSLLADGRPRVAQDHQFGIHRQFEIGEALSQAIQVRGTAAPMQWRMRLECRLG